ncbi:MAG: aminotransferase class V-fold PLP-dependent enzyme [Nitrosopumilaceae archaeon]
MDPDYDVTQDFPKSLRIYLNNASSSLMPVSSIKATADFLLEYNEKGPDSKHSEEFINELLRRARKTISKLIRCEPEEVVFNQSTTDGVNLVASGLRLRPESNIIIRDSVHEHHSNYYPWLRLSKKHQIKNLKIDENGLFDLADLEKLIDDNTSLVALSHALYNTGTILPVKEIGRILEEKNIPYFIDSAQTVGCLEEVSPDKIKSSFMAFNGSKWLCGPMGIGIFYCNKKSADQLEPLQIAGESAILYDENKLAHKDLPDKFQAGFRNYAGIAGLDASVSYLLRYGVLNVRQKNMKLANMLRDELSKISGITLYGPEDPAKRTSIVSFTINNHDPDAVVQRLEKENIILAVREIFDKKVIRASPHFFNTDSQILEVIDTLKKM